MRLRGRLARQYPRLVLVPAVNEVVPTRVAAWLRGNYNSLSRARADKLPCGACGHRQNCGFVPAANALVPENPLFKGLSVSLA